MLKLGGSLLQRPLAGWDHAQRQWATKAVGETTAEDPHMEQVRDTALLPTLAGEAVQNYGISDPIAGEVDAHDTGILTGPPTLTYKTHPCCYCGTRTGLQCLKELISMLPIRVGTGLRNLATALLFAGQARADDGRYVIIDPLGSNIVLCMGVVAFFVTLAVLAWSTTHIFHVRASRLHATVAAPVEPVAPVDPTPLLRTEPVASEVAVPEPEAEVENIAVPHCYFSKEILARKAEFMNLSNDQLRDILRAMGVYSGTSSTKDLMALAAAAGSKVPAPDLARLVRKIGSKVIGKDRITALSFIVVA